MPVHATKTQRKENGTVRVEIISLLNKVEFSGHPVHHNYYAPQRLSGSYRQSRTKGYTQDGFFGSGSFCSLPWYSCHRPPVAANEQKKVPATGQIVADISSHISIPDHRLITLHRTRASSSSLQALMRSTGSNAHA